MLAEISNKLDELVDKINTVDTATNANTAKTSFPGFGTSSTTALAGDTTTISTAQAREISRSTIHNTKLDLQKSAILFGRRS